MKNSEGMLLPKTIVVASDFDSSRRSRKSRKLQADAIQLEKSDIDENGDVVLKFKSLENHDLADLIKFDARIGIASDCNPVEEAIGVVDMSTMVLTKRTPEPTLVVNGGWFRRATELHNIECDWEPVILSVVISDPENAYTQLGRMDSPIRAAVMKDDDRDNDHDPLHRRRHLSEDERRQVHHRRNLLKASPSAEELSINDEMRQGRRPSEYSQPRSSYGSSRHLGSGIHKKILVHGYCSSSSPFTFDHFSDAIEFKDPHDDGIPNWSIDTFARKIDEFADENDIEGCGIIAHSQGGLAALHLYRSYWSCLDYGNKGGSRMIQTVGSPWRGSPLMIFLSELAAVFGLGCGYQVDLSESGADNWLSGIPSWARQKVHYYTTSFKDNWWSYDYCSFLSDLILDDPDDGGIEKGRSTLAFGNNKGHTEGQCHTDEMVSSDNSAQCRDRSRNSYMDSYARY